MASDLILSSWKEANAAVALCSSRPQNREGEPLTDLLPYAGQQFRIGEEQAFGLSDELRRDHSTVEA